MWGAAIVSLSINGASAMSVALRQQIDRTIELALAAGFGLTITVQPPARQGQHIVDVGTNRHGLHPECYRLLTHLAKAKGGILSLDAYATATVRALVETRAAIRGAHRSKDYIVAMDTMYRRFDGERPGGGKMRCYEITERGRRLLLT